MIYIDIQIDIQILIHRLIDIQVDTQIDSAATFFCLCTKDYIFAPMDNDRPYFNTKNTKQKARSFFNKSPKTLN